MQIKHIVSSEFIRFLCIGVLNTAVGYLIFSIFYFFTQDKVLALLIAYLFGILFNYKTYGKYVFIASNKKIFINFLFIYLSIFIFNILILELFINELMINTYAAQFIAICVITPILFFLNKKHVFIIHKE